MKTFKDDFPKVGDLITLGMWSYSYVVFQVGDLSHLCNKRQKVQCDKKCLSLEEAKLLPFCYSNEYNWKHGDSLCMWTRHFN